MAMTGFLFDLRYALRLLGRNRGFAVTAILTLALGIGANSAIFAVVHAVLYRAPVYQQPDRVVAVTRTTPQSSDDGHAAADYLDIARDSRSFSALAAYRQDILDLSSGGGDPERVPGAQVSAAFFDVFEVPAVAGRAFSAGDDPRGERLVVLGHGVWQRRFGGDPAVVGQTVRINREPYTVVGVMPPAFRLPGDAEAWIMAPGPVPTPPLAVEGDLLSNRQVHYFNAVARLRPGVTVEQARSDLASVAAALAERHPQTNDGQGFGVVPFRELTTQEARAGLFILLAAVGFVLLVACANIAGLMLARATGRRQELALRAALGAGRARLVRQLLIESVVIGLAGGGLGLLLAWWGVDVLLALAPRELSLAGPIGLDATVTLFTLALGVAASLLFGVLPALQAARAGLLPALRSGEIRVAGRGSRRMMSALVVVEVALGVVLTVGAGLTVNTLLALRDVDPGYLTENVVRVPLPVPASRYGTSEQQAEFYTALLERLAGNPTTRLSAAVFPPPLSGASASGGVQVEGRPAVTDRERPVAAITWVSPGYFKVMGIPLRRGRDVGARDAKGTPLVALISETGAARLWPGEDPIGKRFNFGSDDPGWITVVGVVGDIRHSALAAGPQPIAYIPIRQSALPLMTIMVRTDAGAGAVASAVRAAVRQLDPDVPVSDVRAFSEFVADSIGEPRLRAMLLSGFAAAALLLAAVGVYGLLSYTVAQRAREIGIRLALGASPGRVYREVVAGGLKLAVAGLAVGVPAALGLSRLIASQLFGVGASDPRTFGAVTLLLVVVALAASLGPARRVLSIDPASALRTE